MKDHFEDPQRPPPEDGGRDFLLSGALRSLDPASRDPDYWSRFHAGVMAAAREELAHRRMMADVTVSELVTAWGRALVPAAVLAAAAAAFLLFQPAAGPSSSSGEPMALEEMFEAEFGELVRDTGVDDGMDVTFASEGF